MTIHDIKTESGREGHINNGANNEEASTYT